MDGTRWCDFEKLAEHLVREFPGSRYSIHGETHWRRVEQNGLRLAGRTGADLFVIRLFAWFHDSKRENDDTDPGHGRRGAEYAITLRGEFFELEDEAFGKLVYACIWHTDQDRSDDPTIGTCWDADRLDLGRVGVIPAAGFMSTEFGRQVADAGSFFLFSDEAAQNRRN